MAKEVNKRVNVWLNSQGIENNLKSIKQEITKTANELNRLPIGSEEWLRKSEKLGKLKDIYAEVRKEIGATERELKSFGEQIDKRIVNAGAISAVYQTASAAVQRFVSATQEYVDAYATLDDAMTNVSKYTGLTREEVKQLNDEFRKMDTRTPTEKLNALAADAGRLGITSKEAIKDFVEAADIINVALGEDLGEDAVKEIGKLAEMFGTTETMGLRGAMLATGSAINTLAQSSSASERYLMDFTSRLAGAANQAQISQANILGFASVLDQNKQQVEMSATALQKLLMNMFTAPEKYAHLSGMSVKEFADALKNDANEALITFLDTLNKKGGLSELAPIFKDLGLDGARASGVISVLAGKIDDVREAQATANAAFAEGNSVINEAAAVNGNAAAQLDKAKKAVQDAKAALGEELLPVITQLTQTSAGGLRTAAAAVKWIIDNKGAVLTYAGALAALWAIKNKNLILDKLTAAQMAIEKAGLATTTTFVNLYALAKAKLTKNTLAAANAQKALRAAFAATPWGAIITAVTALASAFVFMRDKTDESAEAQENLEISIDQQFNSEKKKVEELQSVIESETATREQKMKAINTLKSLIPDYVAELDKEGKVVNNNRKAIDDYLVSLKNKIRYQSLEKGLNETENKILEAEVKDRKARDEYFAQSWGAEAWDKTKSFLFGGWSKKQVMENADAELRGLYDIRDGYQKKMKQMDDDLVKEVGKTYHELYSTYNENILGDLDGNGSSSPTGNTPDKKTLTARENFQKRLQQMEGKAQTDTLDGWEKTKQEIINKYGELLAEAKTLYGEDSEEFKKVQQLKLDAIAAAGQQYLEKNGKILEDFSRKFQDWQKEVLPKGEDGLADKLLGTEQKWRERTVYAQNALNTLIALRGELADEPDVDLSSIDAEIERTETELLVNLPQMALADLQSTLRQQHSDIGKFIAQEQESITDSTLTETERQKKAIRERYDVEIRALEELQKEYLKNNMMDKAVEAAEDLERLKALMDAALANVDKAASSGQKSVWQELAEFDWSNMSGNWQQGLYLMTQGLQEFGGAAMDIFGSINQIMANMTEAELQRNQEAYDAKTAALQRQLDQGLISQKRYDAQMEKLQADKERKERKLKHEQFAREKAADIVQAIVNGALSITNIWATNGGVPILAAALTAVAAAVNAAQIAAIASQPNPYAKGGYIRGRQYAVMGEQGDEWVASNRLLRDKETAAVIAALDDYQRGNRNALAGISFAAPDPKIMSQAVSGNGRTFAPSNQTTTNNYYQNDNGELLKELRQLNEYLRDPNNRRAYISRKIQLEFDEQEQEVRELARL